jgi:hypothetical protein
LGGIRHQYTVVTLGLQMPFLGAPSKAALYSVSNKKTIKLIIMIYIKFFACQNAPHLN